MVSKVFPSGVLQRSLGFVYGGGGGLSETSGSTTVTRPLLGRVYGG